MIDSFISPDLAVAPNPLGLISSLQLKTIPIDACTFFELWVPANDLTLIPEEAILLKDDRSRLEEICGQLTWLFGATLFQAGTAYTLEPVYDWPQLIDLIHGLGGGFDGMTVEHSPALICSNEKGDGIATAWTLRPTSWQISFLALKPTERGYVSEVMPISLSISCGKSKTKRVETVAVAMT